jgi:hypothetical protein
MKMSEVRIGMRLRSTVEPKECITVIGSPAVWATPEQINIGFAYSLDSAKPLIPRMGMSVAKDGHQHYGLNGFALYEPVSRLTRFVCWFSRKFFDIHDYFEDWGGDGTPRPFFEYTCWNCGKRFGI